MKMKININMNSADSENNQPISPAAPSSGISLLTCIERTVVIIIGIGVGAFVAEIVAELMGWKGFC
jgi:hypothetical protein